MICRFHNREYLLDYDGARERYRQCLGVAVSRTDTRLFAYCLMASHIHLVLQLGTIPLGTFTRIANTAWSNWLNKRYKRLGTSMADRPKSVFCDSSTYALDLVRYVHNNPVRAGVVKTAEESTWSSHRAYIGKEDPPDWLEIDPVLYRLSDDAEEARRSFDKFVDEGKHEPRRPEFSGEVSAEMSKRIRSLVKGPVEISYPVLGPDEFILSVFGKQEKKNIDRSQFSNVSIGAMDVLHAVCEETGLKKDDLLGKSRLRHLTRGRKLVASVWCERLGKPQAPITDMFGVRASAVSQWLRSMRASVNKEQEKDIIENVLRRIRKKLIQLIEKAQKDPKQERSAKDAQVMLLQRLREVEERLFGQQLFGEGSEKDEE